MNRDSREPAVEAPSKSQRKRDAHALFQLGRDLVELRPSVLRKIPLESKLLDAVEAARGIKSHVARKRQLQFVAKLLRGMETAPIREAMEAMQLASRQLVVRHHRVEAWRDSLLEGGDSVVAGLVRTYPNANPQTLRQLLRNARREAELNRPPAAARKLFKLLREMDEAAPLPPPPALK